MNGGRKRVWPSAAVAALVATALSILFVDRPASSFSHEVLHGAALFIGLTHIVDPVLPIAAIGLLVGGTAGLLGWRPGRNAQAFLCACIAVLVAVSIKDQAKFAFGRLWPETWVNNNPSWIANGAYGFAPFHGGAGWSSFPSGHMTVITAPMVVLALAMRRWRWIAAIPVLLVAIGLFGADYHFVGDMIAGTLLGSLCAAIAVGVVDRRLATEMETRSAATGEPTTPAQFIRAVHLD